MMSNDLRETLRAGTADLPPSRRIDLPRAMREGTRARRRRRALTSVVAAVAVVCLALAVPAGLPGSLRRSAPAVPARPSSGPLVVDISPGWLPGKLDVSEPAGVTVGGDGMVGLIYPDDHPTDQHPLLAITAFDPAVRTDFAAFVRKELASSTSSPGPTIKGSPSTWTRLTDDIGGTLTWQPNAKTWVMVGLVVSEVDSRKEAPELTAERIARTLRFGVGHRVRFPFSVAVPKETVRSYDTVQVWDGSEWAGVVEFGEGLMPASAGESLYSWDFSHTPGVTVNVVPAGTRMDCQGGTDFTRATTPGGREAFVHYTTDAGCVILSDVHGEEVWVVIVGSSTVRAMPLKAALAFADTVQVVPRPKDRTTWVKPVR